jgi:hypothetical protein
MTHNSGNVVVVVVTKVIMIMRVMAWSATKQTSAEIDTQILISSGQYQKKNVFFK